MEHFVEILVFTMLNHIKVPEVEPALLKLKYCISLGIILVLQRLLLLVEEPLDDRGLILAKAFNRVGCVLDDVVAELLCKHFLLGDSINRQQFRVHWVDSTAHVLHFSDDLFDFFEVCVFLRLVFRFFYVDFLSFIVFLL